MMNYDGFRPVQRSGVGRKGTSWVATRDSSLAPIKFGAGLFILACPGKTKQILVLLGIVHCILDYYI